MEKILSVGTYISAAGGGRGECENGRETGGGRKYGEKAETAGKPAAGGGRGECENGRETGGGRRSGRKRKQQGNGRQRMEVPGDASVRSLRPLPAVKKTLRINCVSSTN